MLNTSRWLRANLNLNAYATLKSVALNHGTAPNFSEIGREIGVSHITVGRWIRTLAEAGLLRLVFPLPINSDRRLVKSPKIFLCNTGLHNRLLGISNLAHLLKAPQKEQIFSGYLLEEIATRARRTGQPSRFYYYGGFGGPHIYVFKLFSSLQPHSINETGWFSDSHCVRKLLKEDLFYMQE